GGAAGVPRVAGRAVGHGLGGGRGTQLGHVRPPEEDEAGRAEARREVRVVALYPLELAQQPHTRVIRIARRVADQVLQQEGHAAALMVAAQLEAVVTYDARMAAGARLLGLRVAAPA